MGDNDEYLEYVMEKAREIGKEFVIDTGEGNEYLDNKRGWNIENLSGWLVEKHEVSFVKAARSERDTDKFFASYVFAYWEFDLNEKLHIRFEYVRNYE